MNSVVESSFATKNNIDFREELREN